MTDLTEHLAAIKARVEAATEGPWIARSPHPLSDSWIEGAKIAGYRSQVSNRISDVRDAEFIANARTDLPQLVAALEAVLLAVDNAESPCLGPAIVSEYTGAVGVPVTTLRRTIAAAFGVEGGA